MAASGVADAAASELQSTGRNGRFGQ
jgi:hypothetical protein